MSKHLFIVLPLREHVDLLRDIVNICVNKARANIKLPLIEWINRNVNPNWSLSKGLGYGLAIHDGSLQKHIGA